MHRNMMTKLCGETAPKEFQQREKMQKIALYEAGRLIRQSARLPLSSSAICLCEPVLGCFLSQKAQQMIAVGCSL